MSPHYLSLLGVEVLHGRLFDDVEGRGNAAVAVLGDIHVKDLLVERLGAIASDRQFLARIQS